MGTELTAQSKRSEMASTAVNVFPLVYFVIYLGTLFVTQENEFMHWITLVLLPLMILMIFNRIQTGHLDLRTALAMAGITRSGLKRGLGLAVVLGLVLSALQVVISESADEIIQVITSGRVLYLMPLAFILMVLTAAFTEEFFFRGVLQSRLHALINSKIVVLLISAFIFGIYHLPYAYLNPNWPSAGDFQAALTSALFQGGMGGLILGWLYIKTDNNLIACVVCHALINSLPVTTMIKFGAQ